MELMVRIKCSSCWCAYEINKPYDYQQPPRCPNCNVSLKLNLSELLLPVIINLCKLQGVDGSDAINLTFQARHDNQ